MSKRELQGILRTLRRELTRFLDDQLVSVILYGSRARGQARSDSDIDVLVVVRDDSDDGDLIRRTSTAVAALSLQHDVVISRTFVSTERFEHEQTPFLLNVRREGVPGMKAEVAALLDKAASSRHRGHSFSPRVVAIASFTHR